MAYPSGSEKFSREALERVEPEQYEEGDDVTVRNFVAGARVARGRNWEHEDQDGGTVGSFGVLVSLDSEYGKCTVKWKATDETHTYRIVEDHCDLKYLAAKKAIKKTTSDPQMSPMRTISVSLLSHKLLFYIFVCLVLGKHLVIFVTFVTFVCRHSLKCYPFNVDRMTMPWHLPPSTSRQHSNEFAPFFFFFSPLILHFWISYISF